MGLVHSKTRRRHRAAAVYNRAYDFVMINCHYRPDCNPPQNPFTRDHRNRKGIARNICRKHRLRFAQYRNTLSVVFLILFPCFRPQLGSAVSTRPRYTSDHMISQRLNTAAEIQQNKVTNRTHHVKARARIICRKDPGATYRIGCILNPIPDIRKMKVPIPPFRSRQSVRTTSVYNRPNDFVTINSIGIRPQNPPLSGPVIWKFSRKLHGGAMFFCISME